MLFTVRETADMLGVSRNRVYELINSRAVGVDQAGSVGVNPIVFDTTVR